MRSATTRVRHIYFLMKLLCVPGVPLATPCVRAADLAQTYQAAVAHDSSLASAQAAYRAGVELLPQAKAGLGPNVQADASINQATTRVSGSGTESGRTSSSAITATQPIYRPVIRLAVRQAEARQPALEAQLHKAQQALILRVAQSYFEVLQALDALSATSTQKEALESQRRQATRAYQIGTGNVIDEADAGSRYDLIVATELQARGGLRLARRSLEQLTGEPMNALARLAPIDFGKLADVDEGEWLSLADSSNPDVRTARAQLAAERYEIDLANAAFKPTLDAVASVTTVTSSQSNLDLSRTNGRSAAIGLTLTVPLWEPGLRNSKMRQALALVDQYEQDLLTSQRDAALAVRQSIATLGTSAAQAQALERAVQSTQVSLQASQRGSEIGSRTVLDVLNARQQVFQAKTQLTGSRYAAVMALLQLKAAAGVLSEKDLHELTDPKNIAETSGPTPSRPQAAASAVPR